MIPALERIKQLAEFDEEKWHKQFSADLYGRESRKDKSVLEEFHRWGSRWEGRRLAPLIAQLCQALERVMWMHSLKCDSEEYAAYCAEISKLLDGVE